MEDIWDGIFISIIDGYFFIILGLSLVALQLIANILVSAASFGLSNIAFAAIGFIIPILMMGIFMASGEDSISELFLDGVLWLYNLAGLPTHNDPFWENGLGLAVLDLTSTICTIGTNLFVNGMGFKAAFGGDSTGLLLCLFGFMIGMFSTGFENADEDNYLSQIAGRMLTIVGVILSVIGFCLTLKTDVNDATGGPFSYFEETMSGIIVAYDIIDLGFVFADLWYYIDIFIDAWRNLPRIGGSI